MPAHPSSPTPSDSSEEVILFHGRNKPAIVTLPATAVNPPKRRVKYTEPPLQPKTSTMPCFPVTAATLPATAATLPATAVTLPATAVTLPATAVTLPASAVNIPATAVTSSERRVKYTEPTLDLTASTMPDPPATAVTLPASAVISSNEDAERQFQLKVDEYRQEMLAHARSGAPPAIVNPHRPGCYHYCKWERSVEMGRVCAGDDCKRTIGKGVQFLMACRDHDCGLLACFTHQRKVTNHSTRSTARGRRTGL
jgi:hypothetical protein